MPLRKLEHHLLTSPTSRIPFVVPSPDSDSEHDPVATDEQSAAWFESLTQLDIWWKGYEESKHKRADDEAWIKRQWQDRGGDKRLLCCHDFKGGYADQPFERGYSFEWFSHVDTFVYFSHHRVTIPPEDWITAAHVHGTRMLGTLIFEWAASLPDLSTVLLGPSSPSRGSRTFVNPSARRPDKWSMLSTHYADVLIDLAVEKGFDGYLVNVECNLFEGEGEDPVKGGQWAAAIRVWCEYFRREGERRLGSGFEVSWYDSISHLTGNLEWKSRLDPVHTLPFACSASSVFLDYHWRPFFSPVLSRLVWNLANHVFRSRSNESSLAPDHRPETLGDLGVAWRSNLLPRRPTDTYLGIDLFGRGCPFGGGFSSSRAAIEAFPSGLGVAMFGNAWVWECHHLHPGREGKEGGQGWWRDWWEDERYLWTGLTDLESAPGSGLVVRREPFTGNAQRDPERIQRETSATTTFSHLPVHVPWADLFPSRPPFECSFELASGWSTTFSLGSGSRFWVRGENVLDATWTDVGMTSPKPDLGIGGAPGWTIKEGKIEKTDHRGAVEMVDADGWLGSGSARLHLQGGTALRDAGQPLAVPLVTTACPLRPAGRIDVSIIWKSAPDGALFEDPVGLYIGVGPAAASGGTNAQSFGGSTDAVPVVLAGESVRDLKVEKEAVVDLPHGWRRSAISLGFADAPLTGGRASASIVISQVGLAFAHRKAVDVLVGSVAVSPEESSADAESVSASVDWTPANAPGQATPGSRWGHITFSATDALCLVYATSSTADTPELFLGTSKSVPERRGRRRSFLVAGLAPEWDGILIRSVVPGAEALREVGGIALRGGS